MYFVIHRWNTSFPNMLCLVTSFIGLSFVPFTGENFTMKFFSCKHGTYVQNKAEFVVESCIDC
jgi:hypothetical protein